MQPSDRDLWEQAGAGAGEAFGLLFDRHSRAVYNHCFRLTASWATAEDLTSATFLLAWRRRDRMRLANDSLRPWLLAVATNAVRSERRSMRRRLTLAERVPVESPTADHADDVAGRVDDERRMAVVLAELHKLPRNEQQAVALCLWSGVSYADAAASLGIAEVSVRSRVSRARSKLRAALVPALTEETS
jgi:RNA polymerase sigma factor (sigma-70 family)